MGKKEKGKREGREEKGRIHVLHVTIFVSLIHSWNLICKILSVIMIITLKCVQLYFVATMASRPV